MNKPTKLALSLVCVSVLSACSFDDDKPSPAPVVDTPPPPPTYLLSGTVTGLSGELSVTAGEEEVTVTEDGAIAFTTEFNSGDTVTASITAAPELQECAITSDTEFTFDDADIDALALECRDLELYVALADSAETANDSAVSIDVLANDASEYATEFDITAVTQPQNGTAEISEQAIVYTPNAGFAGTDTFSYTATDGAQEDTAEVTVTSTQSLTVNGLVTDGPIANAAVSITISGETFTATADESGAYTLELQLSDTSGSAYPQLKAQGAGEQEFVTLSARLPAAQMLLSAAGDDRTLVRSELNEVNVTQMTTAKDTVLSLLAGEEGISADTIDSLNGQLDGELVLEMAAVIKLLVDNPNYSLPSGIATISELLSNPDAYSDFVATAGADIAAAIDETLNDPNVSPTTGWASVYGNYVAQTRAVDYYLPYSAGVFVLTADDIRVDSAEPSTYTLIGNTIAADGQGFYGYEYLYLSDERIPLSDEQRSEFGKWQISFRVNAVNREYRLADVSGTGIDVYVTQDLVTEPQTVRFSSNGQVVEIPSFTFAENARSLLTFRDVDAIAEQALAFSIEPGDTHYLTGAFLWDYSTEDEWGTVGYFDNVTFNADGTVTSAVVENDPGIRTWALSDDKKHLTITLPLETETYIYDYYLIRDDEHGALAFSQVTHEIAGEQIYYDYFITPTAELTVRDQSALLNDNGESVLQLRGADHWSPEAGLNYEAIDNYNFFLTSLSFEPGGNYYEWSLRCAGSVGPVINCATQEYVWGKSVLYGTWEQTDQHLKVSYGPNLCGQGECLDEYYSLVGDNASTGVMNYIYIQDMLLGYDPSNPDDWTKGEPYFFQGVKIGHDPLYAPNRAGATALPEFSKTQPWTKAGDKKEPQGELLLK